MQRYTWLVFDADGTLFDFDDAEATALRQSIEQVGHTYEERFLSEYRRINRKIWHAFERGEVPQDTLKIRRFETFFKAMEIDAEPAAFSQRYLGNLAKGNRLLADAQEVVEFLAEKYRLMIITNGVKEVQRSRFEASTIHQHLDTIVVSGEIGAAKPSPEIFDVAFAAMGHPNKEETLIIGDSLSSDIVGGDNYGIDTCWYNPNQQEREGEVGITYEIKRLTELKEILGT